MGLSLFILGFHLKKIKINNFHKAKKLILYNSMAVVSNTDFGTAWKGGDKPFAASYGKLMMWFF